jgi:hypothetical protein
LDKVAVELKEAGAPGSYVVVPIGVLIEKMRRKVVDPAHGLLSLDPGATYTVAPAGEMVGR